MLGPLVVEQIQRLHADHAVLTIGAVDPAGNFMDFNAEEAFVARAMIASARRTTVLADSSKLDRHALFQVCEATQVHRLVTDQRPDRGAGEPAASAPGWRSSLPSAARRLTLCDRIGLAPAFSPERSYDC